MKNMSHSLNHGFAMHTFAPSPQLSPVPCKGPSRVASVHVQRMYSASCLLRPSRARAAPSNASSVAGSAPLDLRVVSVSLPDDEGGLLKAEVHTTSSSQVIAVQVKKPLGLVLSDIQGAIVVDSVVDGGHAAAAGVRRGDILKFTTARNRPAAAASGGSSRRGGKETFFGQLVLLDTLGESFATVSAAIKSNMCSQCPIGLVFERPMQ